MSSSKISLLIIRIFAKFLLTIFAIILVSILAVPVGFYGMALYLEPTLPSVKQIKEAERQMPLQVYSKDNKLIGQYGNRMSLPITYKEIPPDMIHAFLAAEDAYFFEHSGISVKGLGRAITQLLTDNSAQTGGSTITMQVAKNYFLTFDQTFKRKLTELFLSRKIEQELSKKDILTLYINKIYLGEGAYGIKAAAKKYYSKSLDHLTIAESAMLAGLPKAPSSYNPVVNPDRALERRNWILKRMYDLQYISLNQYNKALKAPIGLNLYEEKLDDKEMPYLSEMARISLVEQFGPEVMNSGWRVRLTIDSKVQHIADNIVRKHLTRYDKQHGWRGAEANNEPLYKFNTFLDMHPALVTKVNRHSFEAQIKSGKVIEVPWSGMSWAKKYYSANRTGRYPSNASKIVSEGDIVRVSPSNESWKLVQVPKIQASLVSLNPDDGSVIALVGGFHFLHSKFNRATNGWRQPGSTIKPLIYSAALEKGYRPNSLIADSPIKIGNWRPRNSDGRYYGPMELRKALYLSRNLVSIRLLRSVGIANARSLLSQFGLDKEKLPTTLSLALGAGQASPLQMATAYSTFANGGHRIQPYLIEQIYNFDNDLLYQAKPKLACAVCFNEQLKKLNKKSDTLKETENEDEKENNDERRALVDQKLANEKVGYEDMTIDELENELNKSKKQIDNSKKLNTEKDIQSEEKSINADAQSDRLKIKPIVYERVEQAPRILSASVAYEMAGILKDVIQRGTATRAKALGRSDIGGKTGTTNNFKDAWFSGFHPSNATVVWMGFDKPSTLGRRQYGGKLALPVWMDFMSYQLKNTPTEWVALNNGAKSKKQQQQTIEITDFGEQKSDSEIEDNTPDLPTGKPYRRKAPTKSISNSFTHSIELRNLSSHSDSKETLPSNSPKRSTVVKKLSLQNDSNTVQLDSIKPIEKEKSKQLETIKVNEIPPLPQ